MDLMIEAKDKEQAVFELMRTFKLPGFDRINDIVPHQRPDENRPWKPKPKKKPKKGKKKTDNLDDIDAKLEAEEEEDLPPPIVPDEEVGMGGPEGRVYWPPTMEDWLRPPKRVIKKKEEGAATPAKKKQKTAATDTASVTSETTGLDQAKTPAKKSAGKRAASSTKKKAPRSVPTPSPSDDDEDGLSSPPLSDLGEEDEAPAVQKRAARPAPTRKKSGRATATKVSYREEDADEMSM
jgi:UV DNA damage endonuclease